MTADSPGPAPVTPGRYRKRPVVIEAVQWHEHGDDPDVVPYPDVRPDAAPCDECPRPLEDHGWIRTLEDGHRVCPADWLITGVKGERYPCKPDIFAATYDPAASGGQDATPGQAAYEAHRTTRRRPGRAWTIWQALGKYERERWEAAAQAAIDAGATPDAPQSAPEKPEVLGHPDDAAEEWLAETYEPDDAKGLYMDHAKEAREALAMAGNSDNEDAPVQAVIAIGHALLAAEERLTAIASAMNSPDNLGSQFGDELLERLEGIADELEMSRKDTGDRIREELAYIRAVIERSTRQ